MYLYLLFAGDNSYPAGGADDFIGAFATLPDAMIAPRRGRNDWAHVAYFDGITLSKVARVWEGHAWVFPGDLAW
jgi:hypothetical protein